MVASSGRTQRVHLGGYFFRYTGVGRQVDVGMGLGERLY